MLTNLKHSGFPPSGFFTVNICILPDSPSNASLSPIAFFSSCFTIFVSVSVRHVMTGEICGRTTVNVSPSVFTSILSLTVTLSSRSTPFASLRGVIEYSVLLIRTTFLFVFPSASSGKAVLSGFLFNGSRVGEQADRKIRTATNKMLEIIRNFLLFIIIHLLLCVVFGFVR